MATEAELTAALRKAHEAGDTRAANLIAQRIKETRAAPARLPEVATQRRTDDPFGSAYGRRLRTYGTGFRQHVGGVEPTPEELAASRAQPEGFRETLGEVAADITVGVPIQAALQPLGMVGGSALAGAAQGAMLPVGPDEGAAQGQRAIAGGVAGTLGGFVGKGIQGLVAPIREAPGSVTQSAINAAKRRGFRLTPAQVSDDPVLRARENRFLGQENTMRPMVKIGQHNERVLGRILTEEMGTSGNDLTDSVVARAKRLAGDLFNKSIKGNVTLDAKLGTDWEALGLSRGRIIKEFKFTPLDKLVQKRGAFTTIAAADYKSVREFLGTKARTDKNMSKLYRDAQRALDDAVERSIASGKATEMTKVDVNNFREARRRWLAILTVEQSRRGGALNPDKLATRIKANYKANTPSTMRELLFIIDNVPEMKNRIGVPAVLRASETLPHVAASPYGVQAFASPGAMLDPLRQRLTTTSSLARARFAPAGPFRRGLADISGGLGSIAAREPVLESMNR